MIVETLADALERGEALPAGTAVRSRRRRPLTLLIYTSGSTGAPKGAMYTERLVANFVAQVSWRWGDSTAPSRRSR